MKKNIIHLIFVVSVFVVLLSSFVRTLFFSEELNQYENRKAEQLIPLTAQSYMDGEFQASMENALTDQAFFSQDMKKAYNTVLSKYMYKVAGFAARQNNERYIKIGEHYLYGQNHLMNTINDFSVVQPKLDTRIQEYNKLFKKYPEHEFYLYFVETDLDNAFDTGEHNPVYDYLKKNIDLPKTHMDEFSIENFDEFQRYFYKTDHHWNADGSYRAYVELVRMLVSKEEPVLTPTQTITLSEDFRGSKTMDKVTAGFREPFVAHRYSFIPMSTYGNDAPAPGYGNQELFLDGVCDKTLTYANYYGDDWGAVTIDTYQPEKETLLIISESYDNAVLRLLATHFDRVISIDLRYFETYIGEKFSIDACLEQYDIDKVLLMGCTDYFGLEEFSLEN